LARVVLDTRSYGAWAGPAHDLGDFHAIFLLALARQKTLWCGGTMRLVMSLLKYIRRLAGLVSNQSCTGIDSW